MLKIIITLLMYFISLVGFAQTSERLDTETKKESRYQIHVVIINYYDKSNHY